MPIVLGGVLLALIFGLSRRPRWQCSNCGAEFYRHNFRSILFLIPWIGFIAAILIAIIGLFFAGNGLHKKPAASPQYRFPKSPTP
jgi:hypothetical protein